MRFRPEADADPGVVVELAPLAIYDELAAVERRCRPTPTWEVAA